MVLVRTEHLDVGFPRWESIGAATAFPPVLGPQSGPQLQSASTAVGEMQSEGARHNASAIGNIFKGAHNAS